MPSLSSLNIAGSALTAQRLRMDVVASNIANAESTRTPQGGPYKRERVIFGPIEASSQSFLAGPGAEANAGGIEVRAIVQDQVPPRLIHDPNHPDADEEGYVAYPNIDLVTEMTDMLSASRAYEASITVINVTKNMAQRAIDIGRI